jgi:hexosaminidase
VLEEYREGELSLNSVCDLFHFPSEHPLIQSGYYFAKVLNRLNKKECSRHLVFKAGVHVGVTVLEAMGLKAEGYEIEIGESGIEIRYRDYAGYVYALESLSQLVQKGKIPFASIKDEPLLEFRGIMIDSARHYLSVSSIKRLIQSMPLSKLNVLHWHIADDESFPLQLESHPELSQGGSYSDSEVYTKKDVQEIVALAVKNAVQVVPELDTPAHVRAWGESEKWKPKDISIRCHGGEGYNAQFDLSQPEVFDLVKDVFKEVDSLFTNSPYLHLGNDEVFGSCWDLRPAIKDFMAKNGISNYGELQVYWRKQIKSVLSPARKTIFWRNDALSATTTPDDIVQYWGAQADTAKCTSLPT